MDEKMEKLELTASSPSQPFAEVDCVVRPSSKSLEQACRVTFQVLFQWLYGGRVTSAALFDKSFLQFGPSSIPDYGRVRAMSIEQTRYSPELLTELS